MLLEKPFKNINSLARQDDEDNRNRVDHAYHNNRHFQALAPTFGSYAPKVKRITGCSCEKTPRIAQMDTELSFWNKK